MKHKAARPFQTTSNITRKPLPNDNLKLQPDNFLFKGKQISLIKEGSTKIFLVP